MVLTFRIGTVGPTKTDTATDVLGMSLKELFEAAWNNEPILSDEVAVLGNTVQVVGPSRLLRRGDLRFLHGWCRFHKGERGSVLCVGFGEVARYMKGLTSFDAIVHRNSLRSLAPNLQSWHQNNTDSMISQNQ